MIKRPSYHCQSLEPDPSSCGQEPGPESRRARRRCLNLERVMDTLEVAHPQEFIQDLVVHSCNVFFNLVLKF